MKFKKSLPICAALAVGLAMGSYATSTVYDITAQMRGDIEVYVDGSMETFKDANGKVVYPVLYNGTTYLPVRAIGGLMDKEVTWDGETTTIYLGDVPAETTEYSRENPAPIGVSQEITFTNAYPKGDYTASVKVTEITRGADAKKMMEDAATLGYIYADNLDDKPEMEFIVAEVNVKMLDATIENPVNIQNTDFDIFDGGYIELFQTINPYLNIDANMYKGGELNGYIILEVDKTDENPMIAFRRDFDGTGGIWFSLAE